jgi:hypothetical protein
MKIDYVNTGNTQLAVLMESSYAGAEAVVAFEHQFPPEFFDLRTGLAGEILQKYSTYNGRLVIVGDFSKITSRSLQDFIRESNRVGRILFLESIDDAIQRL